MRIGTLGSRLGKRADDRITTESIKSEQEKQQTARPLEHQHIPRNKAGNEAHAIARQQGIDQVAQSSSQARNETIPASFVQSTLDTQNTYRTQGRRNYDSD